MKNEVKEILDNIKIVIDEKHYRATCDIDYEDCKILYDYIINLQEKLINLDEAYKNLLQEHEKADNDRHKLFEENEHLKTENEKLTQLWLNSQEKRRKAIEYLEQPYRDNFDYSKAELLNILGGSDE